MIIAGVDEAGRGPVIGPMVMAICSIDKSQEHLLQELGVKDSKLLLPKRREFLFEKIKELCKYEIIILSPKEIDDALFDRTVNLNRLEGKTIAKLVNLIEADKFIIDCPSTNIKAYTEFLYTMMSKDKHLVVEHKADLNNVIVGAASVLAKVTRDRMIEDIKKKVGFDFGSGYPADPRTIDFLKRNWNKYDFFRTSWATYKKVAENKGIQKGISDYK
ncbi:MAG: ribonuclease HII [Candidatus Woesearchaeota archaeon]|jgi:ribonuclease HII